MQQFLEAEKVPGRLGRVGSEQRIRELLERRVPEKRRDDHGDHQHLKRNGFADQKMRIGHQLRAGIAHYLGGSLFGDKDDAPRIFLRVRAEPGLDFILFHRRPWASR